MWFKVRPGDLAFAETAAQRFSFDFHTKLSPQETFDRIVEPQFAPSWVADCKACRWLEPGTIGALRLMELKGLSVEERVIAWEPGKRFAFAIERATVPILRRMVEDMTLEESPTGTRVRWTVAFEPRLFARPLTPILRPRFQKMFAKSAAALGAL